MKIILACIVCFLMVLILVLIKGDYLLGAIPMLIFTWTLGVVWKTITKDKISCLKKAAEQGDNKAQYDLGTCYTEGISVTQDFTYAVKWYRKAAEQENIQAQNNLGVCYAEGIGVAQNLVEAVKWYRKAAEQDFAEAIYALGVCYAEGIGVAKDLAEAGKWEQKAAEQGYLKYLIKGQPWTVPSLGMQFVYVENGRFQMGSNDGESDEKPVHQVTISKCYWIGKYEVTQNEYKKIIGTNPSHFKSGKKPVEMVSWNDAVSFCQKLTERERAAGRLPSGYEYRLPTEAQWEFAARGGIASKGYKYSGSNTLDNVAWYYENSGNSMLSDSSWNYSSLKRRKCQTHEVGTKLPNELGIHDMSGNIWEWCSDWYGGYSVEAITDPSGATAGDLRVNRGGGWSSRAIASRMVNRDNSYPDRKRNRIGFRVALVSS